MRLNSFVRSSRKPWMRLKKEKPKGNAKKKQVEEEEKDNQSDDGQSVASTVTPVEKPTSKKDEPQNQAIGSGTPSQFVDTAAMFDWRTLMDTINKIQSANFWFNQNLAWGSIRVQL